MTPAEFAEWLSAAMPILAQSTDEFGELDAAAGDGDLGVTVGAGAVAVSAALKGLGDAPTLGEVIGAAGSAFGSGNPSSFSTLTSLALRSAAREVIDCTMVSRTTAVGVLGTTAAEIGRRGNSRVGERTVLDALVPSLDALAGAGTAEPAEALAAMLDAARAGAAATADMMPKRGRASWVGERSIGHPDGGATVYVRLLEALVKTAPVARPRESTERQEGNP